MIGPMFAHYRVIEKLGAGGMGEVYRAHDEQLDRDVAIKVLPAGTFDDPAARARLLREARAAAALNHPHVCTVHEVGEADGQIYLAMELVAGAPLDRMIPANGLPVEQVLRYGLQIADAVGHAHDHGVVHRDLKTANTLVTPQGRIKVLDFGLAKRASATALAAATTVVPESQTQGEALAGTLPYMAPEQLRGEASDARSDVWALGVMLHEMATGRRPFGGQTAFELSSAILQQPPEPLPDTMPTGLRAVIGRCLEKTPERRYQRAGEVHAALEAIQTGAAPVHAVRRRQPEWHWRLVLAAVAAAAALGVGWWALQRPAATPSPIGSLVVLPLDNLSGDPEQEYFVAGMHDAIIGELGRIGAFSVIARTSAMRYKGTAKSVPEIAQELNVGGVLEGSVLRADDRVRITLQLIDGQSNRNLWSDSFTRDLSDVIALQADVARDVSRQIAAAFSPSQRARMELSAQRESERRPDPEAYDAYLKGRFHAARLGGQEPRTTALRYFEEAVRRDPMFARAHAALAISSWAFFQPERRNAAKAAAERAIELDSSLSEAHAALGMVQMREWNWRESEKSFQRAIRLDPNSPLAHQWYAELLRLYPERQAEALQEARRAVLLDPLSLLAKTMVGDLLYYQDRYDEAIRAWDDVLELDPDHGVAIYAKGLAYAQKGLGEKAIAAAQEAAERWTDGEVQTTWLLGIGYALQGHREEAKAMLAQLEAPGLIAAVHFVLGDEEQALAWLERASAQNAVGLPMITSECGPRWFGRLCDHPRFRALRAKMGLPPFEPHDRRTP
jgi:TolB-like protein/Tfp pilus assembly protein PilF